MIRLALSLSAALGFVSLLVPAPGWAHDDGPAHTHDTPPEAKPLPTVVENSGPVTVAPTKASPPPKTSGQGFWRFVAAPELMPVPEAAKPHLKGAHGTLVVDTDRDRVYWGLERVGWIAFADKLTKSEIVEGDPVLSSGNLHGADLWRRPGQPALVVAADNVGGRVFLSDTTFKRVARLGIPEGGPYADGKGFAPTDAAFTKAGEVYVTDGYGRAYFMPATTDPLKYQGEFLGGKAVSQTPHGITHDRTDDSLLVSARPEGQVKRWSVKNHGWIESYGLPAGSTVCDVDLWGDYALAPCLDGPDKSPGPIYILNLKQKTIASALRPKEDLGYSEAQHIHDACWYVSGEGADREVYVLFTNWNPGGVGALKLVNLAD
jgi:hypothetical protein